MAVIASGLRRMLDGRLVLYGVGLELPAGAVTGLVGPNGAGKSTLLRLLAGIDSPDGGRVLLDGKPLQAMSPMVRARHVAYLPQAAQAQWPLSGRDVVSLGRMPHGAGFDQLTTADLQAIDDAMQRTGTAGFAARRVDHLSAGERARLLLARALATRADVLLVDEPTAALDPGYQIEAMAALRAEAARGVTVAVALHDLALAARWCDRLVLLAAGRLLGAGPPAHVLQTELLQKAYGVAFGFVEFDGHHLPVATGRP